MYVTSQETADMIMSDCRTFRARIELADGTVINGSQITKIEPSYQSSQEDIAPGKVISQGFTATLTKDCGDLTGKTCRIYFYLIDTDSQFVYDRKKHGDLIEYTHSKLGYFTHAEIARIGAQSSDLIPMGRYTITSCKRQGERISIEAHDGLYNIDEPYVPSVNFPTTVGEIEIDICNKLRIGTPEKHCDIAVSGAVEGATLRDMLSWCASLDNGSFAVLDRMGVLVHKWYTPSSYTISASRADEPEAEKADITYTQLHCLTGEEGDLYSGNAGRCMTFTNPYMTQERLDGIALGIIGFSYRPLTVYHRLGDPRLDIWDIISVENADGEVYNCPVTGIVYSFDGGLSANIDVYGKADGDTGSNAGPVTRSLKQMIANAKNENQMVMQESIDYIKGAKGGYVITQFNEDGQPIATLYTDNLDPELANNIIMINQNGILGTNNGREGVYKTAITNDGRINASQILTGILSSIVVQSTNYSSSANTGSRIDLNDGSFSFGGGRLTFNGSALSVRGRIVSDDTSSRAILDDSYLEFYNKNGSTFQRTARLDNGGHGFYRDGEYLGFIGTNTDADNKRGIVFDLDMSGDYMSWGAKEKSGGSYIQQFTWYRDDGFHVSDDIWVGGSKFSMGNSDFNADIYRSIDMHGWNIYNADISDTSDIRLKENVVPSSVDALESINAVEVVAYDMADGSGHKDIGFIAQSLYEIDPVLAGNGVKNGMEIMTVKPLELIPYLVKAVQQLSDLVTEQRAQIDDLYKRLKLTKKTYKNKKAAVDMNKYKYFKKIAAKGDKCIDKDKKLRS